MLDVPIGYLVGWLTIGDQHMCASDQLRGDAAMTLRQRCKIFPVIWSYDGDFHVDIEINLNL